MLSVSCKAVQQKNAQMLKGALVIRIMNSRKRRTVIKKDAHAYERLRKLFHGSAAFVFFPFLAVFVDIPFAVDINIFFDSTRTPDNAAFGAVVLAIVGTGVIVGDKGNVIVGAACFCIIHIIIVLLFFLLRM